MKKKLLQTLQEQNKHIFKYDIIKNNIILIGILLLCPWITYLNSYQLYKDEKIEESFTLITI